MRSLSRALALVPLALIPALLWAITAHALTSEQTCQQRKIRAQGRLQWCLQKSAAHEIAGGADASTTCNARFQHALSRAGAAGRYLDNGDGTVSDLNTGLMWEKKTGVIGTPNSSDPHDVNSTFTFTSVSLGTALDGTAFTSFLATLNNGACLYTDNPSPTIPNCSANPGCFANHCDWRLPTIVELKGIADESATSCGTGGPCIDPAFGPTQGGYADVVLVNGIYWSATTDVGSRGFAWMVGFSTGGVYDAVKTKDFYVRAVRSGV